MSEVLFINSDYIKRYTGLNGSVEEGYIFPYTLTAQDKHIQLYLGTSLYEKLKTEVANATLTGNYKTLMDDYVLKSLMWWTMVELLPHLYVKVDNGGLVIKTAQNTSPISRNDLQMQIDSARNNALFYSGLLEDYLCENGSLFPEYSNNTGAQISPRQPQKYGSLRISHGKKSNQTQTLARWTKK